jgi:uncharacterized protein YidB (DUF937 family)
MEEAKMGLLDDLFTQATKSGELSKAASAALGSLLAGTAPGQQQTTNQPATDPNANLSDGLANLVEQLRQAGLGDAVNYWIGAGKNHPVAPDPLKSALGEKAIGKMAGDTGVEADDLLSELAKALPVLLDRLTPNGQVPGSNSK